MIKDVASVPRLSNDDFARHPAIRDLATQKRWTISLLLTDKGTKVPMNWGVFREFNVRKIYNLRDKNADGSYASLTDLDEINQYKTFSDSNRALHLEAERDHVFVVDIERNASDYALNLLFKLPFTYLEVSQHGGFHGLIKVPDDLAKKGKYAKVLRATVIKGSADSHRPYDDPTNLPQFECLFNRHFITLTRREFACGVPASLQSRENLVKFLDYLEGNVIPKRGSDDDDDGDFAIPSPEITLEASAVAQSLVESLDPRKLIPAGDPWRNLRKLREIYGHSLTEDHQDHSLFDYRTACRFVSLLYRWKWGVTLGFTGSWDPDLDQRLVQLSDDDLLRVVVQLMQLSGNHPEMCTDVRPRKKWFAQEHYVHGKPWIAYTIALARSQLKPLIRDELDPLGVLPLR